ncbi:MAG: hypothetical protein WCX82_04655 [archaeon]|jgi:rRNA maturation protein Rpf1
MIITTSRNTTALAKKFCKYLAIFLYGVKHIPRGQTNLSKIFEKSSYLGYNHLLLVSKVKEGLSLTVYLRTDKEYLPVSEHIITNINFQTTVPLSQIKKIKQQEVNTDVFFLDKEYLKETKDSEITLKQKDNHFSFFLEKKELGFSFDLK